MANDTRTLQAYSEINVIHGKQELSYSTNPNLKSLLYAGLSVLALAGCERPSLRFEDLPSRWDSKEQRVYALICAGCHEVPSMRNTDIPVIVDGKLAKSGRDPTVENVVKLLTTAGEHPLNYNGALSDEELRGAAAWIINNRLGTR